eukprot:COSAG01_NODE_1818_length_9161_cov_4.764316_3_plen_112_part_00
MGVLPVKLDCSALLWIRRRYNGTLGHHSKGASTAAAVTHTEPGTAGAMAFVKGLGSSGDTGTIDDNYRSIWPYVWANPDALNSMQRPLNLFNDHQVCAAVHALHATIVSSR